MASVVSYYYQYFLQLVGYNNQIVFKVGWLIRQMIIGNVVNFVNQWMNCMIISQELNKIFMVVNFTSLFFYCVSLYTFIYRLDWKLTGFLVCWYIYICA